VLSSIEEPKFGILFKKIESIEELHERIKVIKESEYSGGIISYGVYLTTIQKYQCGRLQETREDVEREVNNVHSDVKKILGIDADFKIVLYSMKRKVASSFNIVKEKNYKDKQVLYRYG